MDKILGWFKAMALHGQSKSALEKTTGSWHYDVVEAGYKCNMTDLQAAIGRTQLRKYPKQLQRRASIARIYAAGFKDCTWCQVPPLEDALRTSSYHLFQLRIKGISAMLRDGIMQNLKGRGIATNVHFQPLPMLTVHQRRGERVADYPESAQLFEESLSLPIHLELSDEDVARVIRAVQEEVETALNA
jgi:dTDP-4-amino-4,6-dideoxygalactose transaminase